MTAVKIKELREKRGELAGVIRKLAELVNTEGRDFTGEEQEQWEKVNADYNLMTRQIEVGERELELEAAESNAGAGGNGVRTGREDIDTRAQVNAEGAGGRVARGLALGADISYEVRDLALRSWFGAQIGLEIPDTWREAARACGIRPEATILEIPLCNTREFRTLQRDGRFQRDQTVGTDSEGGYMVPEGFVPELERALLAFGGMRQVADVLRTADGRDLPWPTVDDTSNAGRLLTEATTITEVAIAFGQFILNAYKYSSDLVLVSAELIQDSAIDIGSTVGSILGERLGRILNTHFTTGDGSSKPNGIETAATIGVTSGVGVWDAFDVIDLIHSVDPAYRPNARLMAHDSIVSLARQFVDSNNQFLWQPSLQLGVPDRLAGYPVTINQDLDSAVSTGNDVMIFGDLRKYKIREVSGIRLRRLVERYADDDQEGFVAFLRADGDLLDAGTAPVKKLRIG